MRLWFWDLVSGFYDFVWLLLFFVCFILTCFIVQNVHHLRHIRNSYGLVLTLPSILFLFLFVVCSSFILSFICRFVVGFVFNLDLLKVVRLQHYSLFKWIFFGGVIVFGLGDDKSHFIVYLLFNASRESKRKKSMRPTIFNYENITAGFGVEHMRRERVCVCVSEALHPWFFTVSGRISVMEKQRLSVDRVKLDFT